MTNHSETTVDVHGPSYPSCDTGCESPVLDLSVRKSPLTSPKSNFDKDPLGSPLQGSIYPEIHLETNNNDSKHTGFQAQGHEVKQIQPQVPTHLYRQEEAYNFSSSNHERKTPSYENSRYMLTPPADSPKKARVQTSYELPSPLEAQTHPAFRMSLPVPMPSVSVPSVLPNLFPTSSTFVPHLQLGNPTISREVPQPYGLLPSEPKKVTRPFKAYPKDPLSMTLVPDMKMDQEFSEFRNRMLDTVKRTNEGTNIKMRRTNKSLNIPTSIADEKDAAYWERRRKNNEAAKRSRDARRAKEDEIAIRAAFLEQQYCHLMSQVKFLTEENTKLKCMLMSRSMAQ